MSSKSQEPGGSNVGLERSAVSWIQSYPDIVPALPGPEYGDWRWSDLPEHEDTPTPFPEHVLQRHASMHDKGIIHKTGHVNEPGDQRWRWRTDAALYEFAQSVQSERGDTLPCGHRRGFKTQNATAGVYECGHADCEELYSREVIEEVFG